MKRDTPAPPSHRPGQSAPELPAPVQKPSRRSFLKVAALGLAALWAGAPVPQPAPQPHHEARHYGRADHLAG